MSIPAQLPILIVNPNSTKGMTDTLETMLDPLLFNSPLRKPTFFTCPEPGIASINSSEDCHASAKACLPHLLPLLDSHSGVLIACYSHHPLVHQLSVHLGGKPVLGIFEASVLSSLAFLAPSLNPENHSSAKRKKFGVVSTGQIWESLLSDAVRSLLGTEDTQALFAGVETTGLSAVELHDSSPEIVNERTKEAVKRLLKKGDVGAICLGCAGFAGLDRTVRKACVEELGDREGEKVKIVDGVKVGYFMIEGMVRSGL